MKMLKIAKKKKEIKKQLLGEYVDRLYKGETIGTQYGAIKLGPGGIPEFKAHITPEKLLSILRKHASYEAEKSKELIDYIIGLRDEPTDLGDLLPEVRHSWLFEEEKQDA